MKKLLNTKYQALLQISQQTFWQIVGKIVASLCTFIVLAIIARNYGEAGTGVYTLALTYLAIFYLLSDFGFNAYVLARVHGFDDKLQAEFNKLLGVRILLSSVLVLIAISLLPFLPFTGIEFSKAVIFGSLSIVAYAMFVTANLIFQSKLRYEFSAAASSIGTLIWLAVAVWFTKLKLTIPFLVLSHLIGWMILTSISFLLLKGLIKKLALEFNLPYMRDIFRNSWPIAATLAVNVIYFRADAFILSYFKGVSDTGIYNVAYQVFQSVLVLPTFIMNSFYPIMVTTLKIEIAKFSRQIKFAAFGLLLISVFLALILYSLSPFIIGLITGTGFIGSVQSLQILTISFPAYFLSSLFMWVMIAKKLYKKLVLIYTLGLIFNILANLMFIPQYSYLAASWITGISEYLILLLQAVILVRKR